MKIKITLFCNFNFLFLLCFIFSFCVPAFFQLSTLLKLFFIFGLFSYIRQQSVLFTFCLDFVCDDLVLTFVKDSRILRDKNKSGDIFLIYDNNNKIPFQLHYFFVSLFPFCNLFYYNIASKYAIAKNRIWNYSTIKYLSIWISIPLHLLPQWKKFIYIKFREGKKKRVCVYTTYTCFWHENKTLL